MTFNPAAPSNSSSPGIFPAQNRTNMQRIKALFNNDHVFNDTASVVPNLPGTDGAHRQVTLINRATPSVLPTGTNAILYSKVDTLAVTQLWFYNGTTNFQITPQVQLIKAIVNFDSTGTIRSQLNVTSVTKNGTGDYTVNYTTPMTNTNYIVLVTGQRQSSGAGVTASISGNATFSAVATVNSVRVDFRNSGGNTVDVTAGCVTIMSVS